MVDYRNFTCGHVKRDDPVSRRFLQHLTMQTSKIAVLIRDGKTGKVVYEPPPLAGPEREDNTWLVRRKIGLGRASKNEWDINSSVGPTFFETMEKHRAWHFGFNEYYDVIIWDLTQGNVARHLYNIIHNVGPCISSRSH